MADDQTLTAGGKKTLIFRINLSMRGSGLIICQESCDHMADESVY